MVLSKLQYYIAQYKKYLKRDRLYAGQYKWEALNNFQAHWDIDHDELYIMFDNCLDSNLSRKLWQGHAWSPKKMMLAFIEMQPDYVKMMFNDLFNEEKSIQTRCDRFVFYCDELLKMYRDEHKATIENSHYHGDYKMISLYLAYRYPEKYTLYDQDAFTKMMIKLGSQKIPRVNDLDRFFKVNNTFYKFLEKDEELMEVSKNLIKGEAFYQKKSLLICHDFYTVCTSPGARVEEY